MNIRMAKLLAIMLSLLMATVLFCTAINAEEMNTQEVITRTCPSCEAAVSDASYCSACGAELPDTTTEVETDNFNFSFTPSAFITNLKYMAAGMVGIFLVIGVIILTILLLGKLTAPKAQDN